MAIKAEFQYEPYGVTEREFKIENNYRNETIFSQGNGYIGTRGTFEEGYDFDIKTGLEGTFINGFYESETIRYGEFNYGFPRKSQTMINVTNAKLIRLYVDGEEFDMREGIITDYSRNLSFETGVLKRDLCWTSPSGKKVKISTQRLISYNCKNLMVLSYRITPLNFNGEIKFESKIDSDVENHTSATNPLIDYGPYGARLIATNLISKGDVQQVTSCVKNNKFYLCTSAYHKLNHESVCINNIETNSVSNTYTVNGEQGKEIILTKYIVYAVDEKEEKQADKLAKEVLSEAIKKDYTVFVKEQEQCLREFWNNSDVIIDGDDLLQQGMRFNLFHIYQSTGRDGLTGVGAKGLSGEGYEGHYFWDTEMYINPFYTHTNPEISRKLLEYRFNTLNKARENARKLGHAKGALYPWRTINGSEASAYYPLGSAQYHINGDISYAVHHYGLISDDIEFMQNMGIEILCETSRVWADVGTFSEHKGGKYSISCVTGPDEYNAIVDNNFYTNLMARENINAALYWLDYFKESDVLFYNTFLRKLNILDQEMEDWKKVADNMYLGYDEMLGIYKQDDTFLQKKPWDNEAIPLEKRSLLYVNYHPLFVFRHQMCKQADTMLALLLNEHNFTLEEIKNNYDYYSKVTLHHSSLSKCISGIIECRLGEYNQAYLSFEESARTDLDDYHHNVYAGIHAANMAGTWMTVTNGFAGMSTTDGNLKFNPYLPEGWNGYSFKIRYKGSQLSVKISKDKVIFNLMEGMHIEFMYRNEKIVLDKSKTSIEVK